MVRKQTSDAGKFLIVWRSGPEVQVNVDQLDPRTEISLNLHRPEQQLANTRAVLEDLFLLLEDYAPAWYTEEHHKRALTALLGRD